MRLAPAFLACVALSRFAGATTWIVDVANGPGTDFTQITAAIAAVSAGDTLLVRPGHYAGFTLDKPLSIVGLGTSSANEASCNWIFVQSLPASSTTLLANLNEDSGTGISIDNSVGAVELDDVLAIGPASVFNCGDVRFRRWMAPRGMSCSASRVEITDSTIVGQPGFSWDCFSHEPGFPALAVSGGEVHVIRTTVIGGQGGLAQCADPGACDQDGGQGGAGILLSSNGRVLVAGDDQQFVQGGHGGISHCSGGMTGPMGPALKLDAGSEMRVSGELLLGNSINLGGVLTMPTPNDPTFNAIDAPRAGMIFTLRVHGPPGATADVILGRRPILVGTAALDEEQMTPVNRVFHLGIIPASGTAGLNYPVSPTWSQGFGVVFQGRVTYADTTVHYTNSVPAILQ